MTVETRWSGLTVTDSLQGEEPETCLVRVLSGSVPVRLSFAPRSEFGQVPTRLAQVEHELQVFGSNDPMRLVAPGVEWEIVDDGQHHTAQATVDLARDRRHDHPGAAARRRRGPVHARRRPRPSPRS